MGKSAALLGYDLNNYRSARRIVSRRSVRNCRKRFVKSVTKRVGTAPSMAQYFAHELERRQHGRPVTLGQHSALRLIVQSHQVAAEPIDQCADGEMNLRVAILSGSFSSCQQVCQSRPINSERPRGGRRFSRIAGSNCFCQHFHLPWCPHRDSTFARQLFIPATQTDVSSLPNIARGKRATNSSTAGARCTAVRLLTRARSSLILHRFGNYW